MSEKYERIKVMDYYGMTLSKIVWRRFRAPHGDIVEKTLEANPGLAAMGPVLPYGTVFDLYIPPPADQQNIRPVVRLFGTV